MAQISIDGLSACIARAQQANASQNDLQAAAQAFEQVHIPPEARRDSHLTVAGQLRCCKQIQAERPLIISVSSCFKRHKSNSSVNACSLNTATCGAVSMSPRNCYRLSGQPRFNISDMQSCNIWRVSGPAPPLIANSKQTLARSTIPTSRANARACCDTSPTLINGTLLLW